MKTKSTTTPKSQPKSTKPSISSKLPRAIGVIFATIFITTLIILTVMIVLSNLVPFQYLIPGVTILTLLAAIIAFFLCFAKTFLPIRILLCLIAGLFSIINLAGISYLAQTFDFFGSLHHQDYITEKYYVIVNHDSTYQTIADLTGKTISTYDENLEIYQEALLDLQATIDADLVTVNYINALPEKLTQHATDAILLSAVHFDVINDDNSDFSANTRIIHTIELKIPANSTMPHPDIDVSTQPFTILISGSDSYGNISDRSRSDVNMLVTINPITHSILLTSIPRDYYVQLHGTTGLRDKLTHAGIYGVDMSLNTIADLLDIPIDYYVKVNFSTVVNLVDTIGGIEVYSDQSFTPWTNRSITIPEGNVHMDGATALAFARERKSYSTGDRHRVQNQQDVLSAIIEKISHSTVILTKYSEILSDISSCLETNLSQDEIAALIRLQLQDMPSWKISEYSLNGHDAREYTYSMGQQPLYVMLPDEATVNIAKRNIQAIIDGEPLPNAK